MPPPPTTPPSRCAVCNKAPSGDSTMKKCSRCRDRLYCGTNCQTLDWSDHKRVCRWYNRYRLCEDGNLHEGKLELITWPFPAEDLGWGACFTEESDDLKRKFEVEYGGDLQKFFEYWPQGFRWTCCGTSGDMQWGCDHHGTGSKPCTCDYCKMGKPAPREDSVSRVGLNLSRGPDPRSRRMWF
ncbi:hypothetical protein BXZ70DRAFT_920313 [Cristinia sonorae]|uniref:MYND-type domain-containing protein n=1 Tax=Cristinia sonorae TaxID=1940300 RepID=A0A8K0XT93_9AGAR|nr:hypothetical protein BXZ70DRAFT_920313 [Cristinia sonorae]